MVKVNLIGFEQFQKRLAEAPKKLVREVSREVQAAGQEFARLAKRDAPKNMGQLAGAISVEKIDQLHVKTVAQKEYAPYIEFGTKGNYRAIQGIDASQFKGKGKGDYYDFLNSILDWVKSKGISNVTNSYTGKKVGGKAAKDNLLIVAEAIAWSILRKGIKPQPFFYKQIGVVKPKYEQRIKEILNTL